MSNPWPSAISPASGSWPAELTHHLLAALAYCLLRQEDVLSAGPFFILDAQDLCGPLLAHQLGWLSHIPNSRGVQETSRQSLTL